MDFEKAFAISASGMSVERTRVDVTAANIANAQSTRAVNGGVFRPMRVVSGEQRASFESFLSGGVRALPLNGAKVLQIANVDAAPRLVFDPGHPDANDKGYVSYPGVNQVNEMTNLVVALRAYEANVAAFNAAKVMALKALEIGGQ